MRDDGWRIVDEVTSEEHTFNFSAYLVQNIETSKLAIITQMESDLVKILDQTGQVKGRGAVRYTREIGFDPPGLGLSDESQVKEANGFIVYYFDLLIHSMLSNTANQLLDELSRALLHWHKFKQAKQNNENLLDIEKEYEEATRAYAEKRGRIEEASVKARLGVRDGRLSDYDFNPGLYQLHQGLLPRVQGAKGVADEARKSKDPQRRAQWKLWLETLTLTFLMT